MKKLTAILLALALAAGLSACASTADTPTTAPIAAAEIDAPGETPVEPAETDEPADEDENAASLRELEALLEEFATKVQAGSAGSSLKAAAEAARLMDWAAATPLDEAAISAAAESYLAALGESARAEYLMQIAALDSMCTRLMQPDQEGLLETAGVTECGYPWGDAPTRAIEAVMTALGQRNAAASGATAAYDGILRGYYEAMVDPDNYIDDPTVDTLLNENLAMYVYTGTLGFCYYDVDGNGIDELIIGSVNEYSPRESVFDIYTFAEGELIPVAQGWERNEYRVTESGEIMNRASAGAMNYWYSFYELENGELVRDYVLVYNAEANPDAPYYRVNFDETQQLLSDAEAEAIMSRFENEAIAFDYIPLWEYDVYPQA